jgi:DNA-binding transcriptional MerR regulator
MVLQIDSLPFCSLKFHFAKLPFTGEAKPNQKLTTMSNPEEIQIKNKFADESAGMFADASTLDTSVSPVYYGFNCTPRQVRYYKVEKSVESIMKGGYTRSSVVKFVDKIKEKNENCNVTLAGYKEELNSVEASFCSAKDSLTRNLLRKKRNQLDTKIYNYECDKTDKYQKAIDTLTQFLA